MGGFDSDMNCEILGQIANTAHQDLTVYTEYVLDYAAVQQYRNLQLKFSFDLWNTGSSIDAFTNYTIHPDIKFKNFLCSFNGSTHVGRRLLTAILHRLGWFDLNYCSKNFVMSCDSVDGHITEYVGDRSILLRKFFIGQNSESFFNTTVNFNYDRFHHTNNIYTLQHKITESFLHVVSETLPTSYYPFVTEKFLYSVVTRGLFVAYAQPTWHDHLETKFGFKKYNKIFDYRFDCITNPVDRLIELVSMISKFSVLSEFDWHDLYQMEMHTIEQNYDHYFSRDYVKFLKHHG